MIINNKKSNLPFKKNLSVALISSCLLFACGGGSDSSSGSSTSLSGTASKGLILGGAVTAYLINTDGTKGAEVGTATTDTTDGSYELTLSSDYDGEALIIEITAVDGSQMKCDLTVCQAALPGQDAITFGQLYPLPNNFELSAVSSGTESDTISINITPLTNIAAGLALDKVAGGAEPSAAADASNYQIADALGLGGDVTELPIVDLTDADAINGADSDALEANLKSAAVVEAALNDSTAGTSLEDALDSFVTQFVDSNGVAETEGTGVNTASVSLEEIAAASQDLATTLVTELEGVNAEDENIAAVETALMTEETDAAAGSTEPTQGDIPDDVGSEGLIATKAFVSQVSTFNLATQLDGANTFEDEISLASDLASSDLDVSSEALALAAKAIAEAVEDVLDSETPQATYQSIDGITVTISISGNTVTYTVDQSLDVENSVGDPTSTTIDLVATMEFSDTIEEVETETPGEEEGLGTFTTTVDGTASLDLALTGSVSTAKVSITINDGSNLIATLTVDEEEVEENSYTEDETTDTYTETESADEQISVTGVDIGLSVTIAQVSNEEVTDPISFTGAFNIAATLLSIDLIETYVEEEVDEYSEEGEYLGYTDTNTDTGTEVINIEGLTASLSGMFSNSTDSIEASVAIAASGIEETCEWDSEWSHSYSSSNGEHDYSHSDSDDCSLTGETASSYGSASISVRMALDIDGIEDDVELEALIQRTGLESGIASIDLSYGGNQLNFDFDTDDIIEDGETTITTTITATLMNHNGVTLTATDVETDYETGSENEDTFETTGVITHGGEEFATVSDEGIVTFSDGTFVTL